MNKLVSFCFAFLLSLLLPAAVPTFNTHAQTQVTLDASKDNTLYEDAAGSLSNGAGPGFFAGKTGGGFIRRGLLAFDIAGAIPSNSTVTSVVLTLDVSQAQPAAQTVALHRALEDWGEGTSTAGGSGGGSGGPATPGDATWLHRFHDNTLWSTPGGAYIATPRATQSVAGLGTYSWGSTPEMVSDVQQWLDMPSSNFGWVVVGNESSASTAKRFNTHEYGVASMRPKLAVTYSETTSVEEEIASTFALHQNYPNPFNPVTTIRFALEARAHTILKVFNLLGQEIATLVDADLPAGAHVVQWNAANVGTGVYVYRLEAGEDVSTRKLILLR
jgi:hypothetical protein